jgi:hypothetical protein
MRYQAGWGVAHDAMVKTIESQRFPKEKFSSQEKKILKEVFSDYLMYIWMVLGDTRCNREGYTTASVMIEQYINKAKEKNNAS